MMDEVVGTAIGADAAINVNAGALGGRNQTTPNDPNQGHPGTIPGTILDAEKVRIGKIIMYTITAVVLGAMLLIGILAGLVGNL